MPVKSVYEFAILIQEVTAIIFMAYCFTNYKGEKLADAKSPKACMGLKLGINISVNSEVLITLLSQWNQSIAESICL